ncbi:hypothetical protein E4U30_005471 [Claviceps sp. LM220 group G6]|nr:hypothetical protein E4U15_003575 [Claviceps sp. LM218 group G6]KAG6092409.1 hypothetical protein E4U30_005471 [Claviceps sp. LM220 group G6]KAG6104329.1 hypothetical protein E4U31_002054 [Claviceps sp. LM219 group G6]
MCLLEGEELVLRGRQRGSESGGEPRSEPEPKLESEVIAEGAPDCEPETERQLGNRKEPEHKLEVESKQQQETAQKEVRAFGRAWKSEFLFDPAWRNLNHGSFGTYPLYIRDKLRAYQDQAEARPDQFIRYEESKLLHRSRAAVAKIVNAPLDTIVFVGNATEGVNTVLRNLRWDSLEKGGQKDVILSFSTVYEACGNAADYIAEYFAGKVEHRTIELEYPVEDADVIAALRDAATQVAREGKRARLAMMDVVTSRPGVVFPWEAAVRVCRELGILSLVDGAQGVGMVRLDLTAADPDFFVSNCHKWLLVPRGCAMLYTPARTQCLLRTALATSHGYVPLSASPAPPGSKSRYVANFEFVGTRDNAPYLCVADAIAWRERVCGGEENILRYLRALNKKGICIVARALGTTHLDNATETLTNCAMGNVALPLRVDDVDAPTALDAAPSAAIIAAPDVVVARENVALVDKWMRERLFDDYKTFMTLFVMQDRYWVRLSAQIYLDEQDYEVAGDILKALCERIRRREYLDPQPAE